MFQPPWLTRRTRWAVPTGAVAAVAVVAAGTVFASAASTTPSLPHRTPQQLIAQIAAPRTGPQTLIGTIQTSAALGLPSLPGADGAGGPGRSSPLSPSWLLSGTHTYQVWYGGPGRLRIAAPVQLGETDLRADGRSLWLWDSRANTATHYLPPAGNGVPVLPAPPPGHSKTSVAYSSSLSIAVDSSEPTTGAMGMTSPPQAAQRFLAAVGPTTTVRVADNVTVAGRAAYQLELAPKSTQSLIGRVDIAVDAATSLPLRVQVFARGAASPAYSVGFTALSFARPDPSNFTFTPPPGAKVRTVRPAAPDLPSGWFRAYGPPGSPPVACHVVRHRTRLGPRRCVLLLPQGRHMAGPGQAGPPHQRLRLRGRPRAVPCKPQGPQVHLAPKGCVLRLPHGPEMTGPLTPGQQKKLARRMGLTPAQFRKLIDGGRGAPAFGLIRPDQLRGCQAGWSAYSPATGLTDPGPCTRRTFGSSWTTVVAFPASSGNQTAGPLGLLLRAARPVHGSWGSGRLLTTSLLSVLVTSDGTVLAGAVTPDTLYADAAQLTAQHARAG
jgi:hypothetical protein